MSKSWGEIRDAALIRCGQKPPKTNADRIRSMTDEELAEWIAGDVLNLTGGSLTMATEAWLDWLKQEVTTNSTT